MQKICIIHAAHMQQICNIPDSLPSCLPLSLSLYPPPFPYLSMTSALLPPSPSLPSFLPPSLSCCLPPSLHSFLPATTMQWRLGRSLFCFHAGRFVYSKTLLCKASKTKLDLMNKYAFIQSKVQIARQVGNLRRLEHMFQMFHMFHGVFQ